MIHVLRKPLSEGTVAANVVKHGVGGLNIDASRVGTTDNLNGGARTCGPVTARAIPTASSEVVRGDRPFQETPEKVPPLECFSPPPTSSSPQADGLET